MLPMLFGLERLQQMFNGVCLDEWSLSFSSTISRRAPFEICHGRSFGKTERDEPLQLVFHAGSELTMLTRWWKQERILEFLEFVSKKCNMAKMQERREWDFLWSAATTSVYSSRKSCPDVLFLWQGNVLVLLCLDRKFEMQKPGEAWESVEIFVVWLLVPHDRKMEFHSCYKQGQGFVHCELWQFFGKMQVRWVWMNEVCWSAMLCWLLAGYPNDEQLMNKAAVDWQGRVCVIWKLWTRRKF